MYNYSATLETDLSIDNTNHQYLGLYQEYIVTFAFHAHALRPNAGLYFANMCFTQIEHAKPGLAYSTANGKWQSVIQQSFMEIQLQPLFLAGCL